MPENAAPSPAIAPDALQPALDLQRTLLRRGALLVALLLLGLGLWSGQALGRAERAALPATARGQSRIVAQLSGPVSTPRADAGLIVTEATQVSPMGQGYLDTPGIHSAEQVAA